MATFKNDVDVCNLALSKFGGGSITAFDEESDLAEDCANLYPATRDYLLSIHPWRFVSGKRQLAKSADVTPVNEWQYAFKLPTKNLSGPWAVYGDDSEHPVHQYEVFGEYIYCDYDKVTIDYSNEVAEEFWPAWFVNFAATAIAADLAGPVADKVSKSEQLRVMAFGAPQMEGRGGMFAQCRRLNAQLQPIQSLFKNGDPLTSARCG